jgi:hypothetical protein
MARTTVSQTIYNKFIESIEADQRIPKEVVEKIKQLHVSALLSDVQSMSALLVEVEKTWRKSNP